MRVRRKADHSLINLLRSTISAQLHGMGFLMMLAGGAFLLPLARQAGPLHFWACFSFWVTGALVFLASTVYHFLSDGYEISERLHLFLENLDHFGIYLFIAGTYTPFVISALSPDWQLPLLFFIWLLAVVGIVYTSLKPRLPRLLRSRKVYTALFVLMGWTLVIRIHEVFSVLSPLKLGLLVSGGLAYTIGAVIYALRRPVLMEGILGYHELWHMMVLLGATLHYFLILSFYL